ncbi:DUF2938 family protein [Maricaulis maris]|uniref:DUF2938 family protein n=1 Tax=Maricaulis maris TaxID=74318 RepID=A0A495D1Z8_9PROT|nr:DUF2938 family protein [Maricaulis maris]RKQ95574.1 hypothetical protein C7435_2677 [Maricaulis maris]
MSDVGATLSSIIAIGIGASLVLDAWVWLRQRWLGVPPLDYGRVGRWAIGRVRGRFDTGRTGGAVTAGEAVVGWLIHFLTGVIFAGVLIAITGPGWLQDPTPGAALMVGVATVLAPFLVLQPALGAGVAASRTPMPWLSRLHSVVSHAVFGLGLYASARLLAVVMTRV